MQKDSVLRTVAVAAILCIACSVLVSGSVVILKDRQDANIELDIKKNLLVASGLLKGNSFTKEQIEEAYSQIDAVVVNLETGEETDIDPQSFDQKKASKDPEKGKLIDSSKDAAGIKRRSKFAPAYKYMEEGQMKMLILPVNGKGLWSTLYGFLALSTDLQTVEGIGFYQHGETPGLGGEIDNPGWKAKWAGKKIYDEDFAVKLKVIKGMANADSTYEIDGLSGATITSNGVTGLVKYWFGEDGFGPYLASLRNGGNTEAHAHEGHNHGGADEQNHDHDSHHKNVGHDHEEHHNHNHGKHHGEEEHKHDDHDDHHNDQGHAHENHHDHGHDEHHDKEGE